MTAQNFSQHQWKNRILIVAFDESDQQNYTEQMRLLKANEKGLVERKLVVYQICNELYKRGLDEKADWQKIDAAVMQKINSKIETNFSVLLMGLDGGMKVRKSEVFSMEELFGIIDAMPMRAREIRNIEKGKK